jgi:hypothetical protein
MAVRVAVWNSRMRGVRPGPATVQIRRLAVLAPTAAPVTLHPTMFAQCVMPHGKDEPPPRSITSTGGAGEGA